MGQVAVVVNSCVAADMSRRKLNELRFAYRELTFAATERELMFAATERELMFAATE